MRVFRKIVFANTILAGLIAGVLAGNVYLIHRMQSIIESAGVSTEFGRRAEWISWTAAGAALIAGVFVCFLTVRTFGGLRARRTEEQRENPVSTREESGDIDRLKRDFISHVSHELKAPLASMQETIHILLERIPGPLNENQRRMLTLNLESNRRLGAMIRNLLDISRVEAGAMEISLQLRDLTALVRSVAAEFETRSREKPVSLKIQVPEEPLFSHCDHDCLIQAVANVIDNALKFSAKEESISIRLERYQRLPETIPGNRKVRLQGAGDDGFALLSVMDRGSGVDDEDKERIFGTFHRARGGENIAVQGLGLGLAVSRSIVEAHGGMIWVEDNPGGGSIFRILLKAASPARLE